MDACNKSEVTETMLQDCNTDSTYSHIDHIEAHNIYKENTVLENKGQLKEKIEEDLIEKTYLLLIDLSSNSQEVPREVYFGTADDNLTVISEFDEHVDGSIFNESKNLSSLDDISTSSKDDDEQSPDTGAGQDEVPYEMILKNNSHYYYKCKLCSYENTKRSLMNRHLKIHSEVRPHVCLICDKSFKLSSSLKTHIKFHKRIKEYCCSYCGLRYRTSGELSRHKKYKHTFEKPHKCDICDYRFVERSKLQRHMRSHTGEKPYQCPHCTFATQDSFRLKRHIRKHTGEKPYMCDICGKQFSQSNSVTLHKKLHYASQSFQCQHCMLTFTRISDLRTHIQKQHTPGEPKLCARCPQVFLDTFSYKTHVKSHAGKKLMKCHSCNYSTTNKTTLSLHFLIHEKEKYFKCQLCHLMFRQKDVLFRHESIYCTARGTENNKKVFVCNECGRQFSYKGNLMRHVIKHSK